MLLSSRSPSAFSHYMAACCEEHIVRVSALMGLSLGTFFWLKEGASHEVDSGNSIQSRDHCRVW